MATIYGYVGNREDAGDIVFAGLARGENIGYDSWGIAVAQKDMVNLIRKVGPMQNLSPTFPTGNIALGHTRWATHGSINEQNAHPQKDCRGNIYVVHNGIIENSSLLKSLLIQKGHVFLSNTDTEVAAHLIEESMSTQNDLAKAVLEAFVQLKGTNVLVVLSVNFDSVIAITNGPFLFLGKGNNETLIASDIQSLNPSTRQIIRLESNQLAVIDQDKIKVLDTMNNFWLTPKVMSYSDLSKSGSVQDGESWMWKEMNQQPSILSLQSTESEEDIRILGNHIKQAKHLFIVGGGSAYHAGTFMKYLFAKAGIHVDVIMPSELVHFTSILDKDSCFLVLSRSGESFAILDAVQTLKEQGTPIYTITNAVWSSLAKLSQMTIPLRAGPERSVIATKTFTATLSLSILLFYALQGSLDQGMEILIGTAKNIEELLSETSLRGILYVAQKIKSTEHFYLVAGGMSFPIISDAAFNLQKGGILHASSFYYGELLNGSLTLLQEDIPCVLLVPTDETYTAMTLCAQHMRSTGAFGIGVASQDASEFQTSFLIPYHDEGWYITASVLLQILVHYIITLRGLDPDKLKNKMQSFAVE